MSKIILVVTHPFGPHQKGDQITDPETVAKAQETHPAHVVRVSVPDDVSPAE